MKYIILNDNGLEMPVIFPPFWDHAKTDQKFPGLEVLSAGFVGRQDGGGALYVWGRSQSLNLPSRPEDLEIIHELLDFRI